MTADLLRNPGTHVRRSGSGRPAGRRSIFEVAANAKNAEVDRIGAGAFVTRGVVFLDEIGDLAPSLQPKLLSVLTGARVYRIGGEGRDDCAFQFRGITLAATWKPDGLRDDLRARLSEHVLNVPSLSERAEDLRMLAENIVAEIKAACDGELARLAPEASVSVSSNTDPAPGSVRCEIDRERLSGLRARVRRFILTPRLMDQLGRVDWSCHGELRGLTQALRRVIVTDGELDRCLTKRGEEVRLSDRADQATRLFHAILAAPTSGGRSLSSAIGDVQKVDRISLVRLLQSDEAARMAVEKKIGLDRLKMTQQLADIKRRSTVSVPTWPHSQTPGPAGDEQAVGLGIDASDLARG